MKKYFALLCVFLAVFSGCGSPLMWNILSPKLVYSGPFGSGTTTDPFRVYDVKTLKQVGSGIDGWDLDANYRQVENIDLSKEKQSWAPIGDRHTGSNDSCFTGSYDGKGDDGALKTITGLTINSTNAYQGLFGYIIDTAGDGSSGVVKNVTLKKITIKGGSNTGGVAGQNEGTVEYCTITGNSRISGAMNVGGIVGVNYNIIIGCAAIGCNIEGTDYNNRGGIAGCNYSSIDSCFATGNVNGSFNVGGIVGNNNGGSISNCYATGDVTGSRTTTNAGGVAGSNSAGSLENCYATGKVSGVDVLGGIVGYYNGNDVRNCVALNASIVGNSASQYGRVAGSVVSGDLLDNYGKNPMQVKLGTITTGSAGDKNGENFTSWYSITWTGLHPDKETAATAVQSPGGSPWWYTGVGNPRLWFE